ncbi:MAG: LLM class flavin-dependent oxidoreductase, partial [Chloroflexi bacterium]|nr:LLM class flavin-dependent oxidoreductase [Chloroflexota bacterium]
SQNPSMLRERYLEAHDLVIRAWTEKDTFAFNGRFNQQRYVNIWPRPVQKPHPPIWVGGKTDAALRRVARLGDGWNGILLSPDEVAELRKRLEKHLSDKGRKLSDVKTALTQNVYWGEAKKAADGGRLSLTGSTDEMADDLKRYEQAGLDHIIMSMSADDTKDTVEQLERFASDVLTKVK